MSPTAKDLSIRQRVYYFERLVGTALTEGATPEAIDDYLTTQGGVQHPDTIRAQALKRKRLPTMGAGELKALGGRAVLRAALGLGPAPVVQSDFALNEEGRPDAGDQANIRLALTKLGYLFSYDAFACATAVSHPSYEGPLDDAVMQRAWLHVDAEFGFRPPLQLFEIVVHDFARQNTHHPIVDYLTALSPWDGTPRLDTWLTTYAGAIDSPYVRAVGALPLVAAVRRVKYPIGVKFDELLVLYGPQGPGKSKLLAALCPRGEWFTDGLALGDDPKRAIENSRGIWISEIPELQGTQREVERIKAYLSRSVDGPVRMAYARLPVRVPRQFVNFGSTNEEFFLKDPTGNRRFWPITVGKMQPDALARDRDQLWAEATLREAQSESIHLPEDLWPVAAEAQEAHREQDPWEELLEEKLDLTKLVVAVAATWSAVGMEFDSAKRDNRSATRIGNAMKRLGFPAKKVLRVELPNGTDKAMRCWVRDRDQARVFLADVAVVERTF